MANNIFDLKHLYKLRQDFIVIGLTGRTGSGCSTFADLMSNYNFKDCDFPEPNNKPDADNNERKYRIAYNFLSENWGSFFIINYCKILSLIAYKEQLQEIEGLIETTLIEFNEKFNISNNLKKETQALEKLRNETSFKCVPEDEVDLYNFFISEDFSNFHNAFQDALKIENDLNRILILHNFCNNLRKGGCYYCDLDPKLGSIYTIAEQIKAIIKGKRRPNKEAPCRVIIDSLRNPLEIMFFKERYSAYYTLAVNPNEDIKEKQLSTKYPSHVEDIKKIDRIEYGDKNKKTDFYKQNVQKCIEKSDLHISFIDDKSVYPFDFHQQVVIFYSLMLQPGFVTPSPQERCMQIAYTAKYNSGCISRQVGAVITDAYFSIKSIGWNNIPEGQVPCLLRSADELLDKNLRDADTTAFSKYEKNTGDKFFPEFQVKFSSIDRTNMQGHNCSFCFKDIQNSITEGKNQVHTKSLHAEENAMMQISKYGGQSLKNGILFTTASPCELCAKKAYQLGITKIFYIDPYPGISMSQILDCGKLKPQTNLFTGAIGRAYHKLYEPFMPYKDEIYIRTGLEITNKLTQLEDEIALLRKENERLKAK
jgi:dCMP deaminase